MILYELASGKVPFDADNFMGILTQHMYKAPVPIRALVPQPQEVPPGLEAIVLKCLSKRPEQRYQSMAEITEDLDKLTAGGIPAAVPEMMNRSGGFNVPADYFKTGAAAGMPAPIPASPPELGFTRSKWPLYAGVAGVLTAVGIVVGIFAFGSDSTAQPDATATAAPVPPPPPLPPEPPAKPAKPSTTQVVIAIEPIDAEVFVGDKNLGSSPVLLEPRRGREEAGRDQARRFQTQVAHGRRVGSPSCPSSSRASPALVTSRRSRSRKKRSRAASPEASPAAGIRPSSIRGSDLPPSQRCRVSAVPTRALERSLPQELRGLCQRLREAGYRSWVVGGCVRDHVLEEAPGRELRGRAQRLGRRPPTRCQRRS